jgi:hypothetical protein
MIAMMSPPEKVLYQVCASTAFPTHLSQNYDFLRRAEESLAESNADFAPWSQQSTIGDVNSWVNESLPLLKAELETVMTCDNIPLATDESESGRQYQCEVLLDREALGIHRNVVLLSPDKPARGWNSRDDPGKGKLIT